MIRYSLMIVVAYGVKVTIHNYSVCFVYFCLIVDCRNFTSFVSFITDGETGILTRGQHSFPFKFQLPESCLPCSFESKPCQIRYYIKVTIDIPYASPPQGMKYFTIIGPHIDCMDEQYLVNVVYDVFSQLFYHCFLFYPSIETTCWP